MEIGNEVVAESLSDDGCLEVVMGVGDGEQSNCFDQLHQEIFVIDRISNFGI